MALRSKKSRRTLRPKNPRRALRLAIRMAGALLVVIAAGTLLFGSAVMRILSDAGRKLDRRMVARLVARDRLIFRTGFEGPCPRDDVSGADLQSAGTTPVRGVRGNARAFEPSRDGWIRFSSPVFRSFDLDGGTISLWAKVEDTGREQRIFWDRGVGSQLGIRVLDGRLEFVYAVSGKLETLSCPFNASGRFVHVAATVSPREAVLYEDGQERARAAVSGDLAFPSHGLLLGGIGHHPFSGAIDEMAVWGRPLSAKEIDRVHRLRPPRRDAIAAAYAAASSACRSAHSFIRGACRILDRVFASVRCPAALRTDLPELVLRLDRDDVRRLRKAHAVSAAAGERIKSASRERPVRATFHGQSGEVGIFFDDAFRISGATTRPAFVLRAEPGFLAPGTGIARLFPPELWPELLPDAQAALPLSERRLVRLSVNGSFEGVYCLAPFDLGAGAWRFDGQRSAAKRYPLFAASRPAGVEPGEEALSEADVAERLRRVGNLLRTDPLFPWSRSEIAWREHEFARARAAASYRPPELSAASLLGGNHSDFHVVTNLDLSVAGPGVAWRSSDPSVLRADGAVSRPAGDLPAEVLLTGAFPDGTERTFRFRVMPESPRLPAIFLHVWNRLEKERRDDFTCIRFPAGGGAPEILSGTASTGGGVHHRGNTSYLKGAKRSMSLEFDRPVSVPGLGHAASHVFLLCGYADSTRLRNRFCYEAFEAMSGLEARRTSPVSWAEVFVNGDYAGVWELCPRPLDAYGEKFSDIYRVRSPTGLWSLVSDDMLDSAKGPVGREGAYDAFLSLAEFVVRSTDADFAARVGDILDIDCFADFQLLLDFTGNFDGRITNQYLGRRKSDGRWVVLPWDYDKTFMDVRAKDLRLSNPLLERLLALRPDVRKRLCERWAELRAGPLSDGAVEAWISREAEFLAPFMPAEFELLPLAETADYAAEVESFRREVRYRLRMMDARYIPSAPGAD